MPPADKQSTSNLIDSQPGQALYRSSDAGQQPFFRQTAVLTKDLSFDDSSSIQVFNPQTTNPRAIVLPHVEHTRRPQVVIRGSGKKAAISARPPEGRAWVVQLAVLSLVLVIAVTTLLTVVPIARGNGASFTLAGSAINQTKGQNNNSSFVTSQQDAANQNGFDANANANQMAGVPKLQPSIPIVDSAGSTLWRFPYGQCTNWADLRYHELSGYWVSWNGDAWQWANNAAAAGWNVSTTPRVHSIVVFQPGVDGAGGVGHVAIVESINADGSIHTSNYNWGSPVYSEQDFPVVGGMSFVWHP